MSGVRSPPSLPVIRTVRKGCFFYTRSEGSIPPMFQSSDDGASSISIRFIALREKTIHRIVFSCAVFATSYKNSPKGLFFLYPLGGINSTYVSRFVRGAYFRSTGRRNTSSPRFACPITQKAGSLATQGVVAAVPIVKLDRA